MAKYDLQVKSDLKEFMDLYFEEKIPELTNYQKAFIDGLNKMEKKFKFDRTKKYYFSHDPGSKEGDKGCTTIFHKEKRKDGLEGDVIIIDEMIYNER